MNSADFCGLENPIINIKLLCIFAERIDNPARVGGWVTVGTLVAERPYRYRLPYRVLINKRR